ncbi:MAG: hypothetical protein JXJ17_04430 [Anaerolineae bacterium]|nr:hypothetical protein [Anaerolineae bacterium]
MTTDPTTTYPTNWGSFTFDELVEMTRKKLLHILNHQMSIPSDLVDDAVQEALFALWTHLTENPNWIKDRNFRTAWGLSNRLAMDGKNKAYLCVERLYRERVANLGDFAGYNANDEPKPPEAEYQVYEKTRYQFSTEFWRDYTLVELRDHADIVWPDGTRRDWVELADLRIDLTNAIEQSLNEAPPNLVPQHAWGFLCALLSIPKDKAAYELGLSVNTITDHMFRSLKSIRNHFKNYLVNR